MNPNFNDVDFLNCICSISPDFESYREILQKIADEYVILIFKENKRSDIILDLLKNVGVTNEQHRLEICNYIEERHVFPEVRKINGRTALQKDDPLALDSLPEIDVLDASILSRIGDECDCGGLSLRDSAKFQYEAAAQKEDAYSMYKLGVYYEFGIGGLQKNINKAKDLYDNAMNQGFSPAIVRLGLFFEFGKGNSEKNLQTALELYERAIEKGSKSAKIRLEIMENTISEERFLSILSTMTSEEICSIGDECVDDTEDSTFFRNAHFFYQLAIEKEKDNIEAIFKLGVCYEHGRGGIPTKDMAKAIEYYRNASDQGHMKALLRLGICYENGAEEINFEKDLPNALACYEKAISYGSILAISRKSYILIDLKQPDFANHCKESAIKGYLGAWFNVAFDYDLGINREKSTRNPSEAIRIFRYVATNDDCSDCAISHLGLLLLRESFQNNFNDDSRAFQYLKYANAYWGYAGFLYALGIGVKQNDYLAFAIFQLESERSAWDPTWAYLVGLYYQEGIAVGKNLEKAKEYFLKAIGDDDNEEDTSDRYVCYPAKFALKRLLETTNEQEKSLKKVNCCLNCKENLALATDLADCLWSCDSPCHVGRNLYSSPRDICYQCPNGNSLQRCRVFICESCYEK